MNNPLGRYVTESYHIRKSQKTLRLGIYRISKGLSYILLFSLCYRYLDVIPIGMILVIFLLLLRGIYHLILGPYNFYRSNRSAKKSRESSTKKKINWLFLYYYAFFLLGLLMIVYIFLVPALKTPVELYDDYIWYEWPLIYLLTWLVWIITLRLTLVSLFRSYNLGDRLARIIHDVGILRSLKEKKRIESKQIFLLLSGFIPASGLLILVLFSSASRFVLAGLSHFFFDTRRFTSLAEDLISHFIYSDFTIYTFSSHLEEWYSHWVIYILAVILIGTLSFLKTLFILKGLYRGKMRSPMGRKIETYFELMDSD